MVIYYSLFIILTIRRKGKTQRLKKIGFVFYFTVIILKVESSPFKIYQRVRTKFISSVLYTLGVLLSSVRQPAGGKTLFTSSAFLNLLPHPPCVQLLTLSALRAAFNLIRPAGTFSKGEGNRTFCFFGERTQTTCFWYKRWILADCCPLFTFI